MPQSIGFLDKLCAADELVYGVEALVTQCLQLISESMVDQPRLLRSTVLDGRPQTRYADQGTIAIGGDLVTRMRYQPGNLLMVNWFGDYNSSTGVYKAVGVTEGNSMTFALDKRVSVWTYTGVKVYKLVIAGSPDGIMLTASSYATELNKTSTLNTQFIIKRLIDPSPNVMFHHIIIRARDQLAPLSNNDKIKVTTFTLTLERPMDQIFVNEQRGSIEPFENNFRNITLAFTIPRYNSDQWHSWKDKDTKLQFEFEMVDPISGSGRTFFLPNVQLDTVGSPVGGPASLPVNVTAMGSEAETFLDSIAVFFTAADNSINIDDGVAVAATGTLTLTGTVSDGETVTVGSDVYEVDTEDVPNLTSNDHIRLDLTGGTTVKAQGTLTLPNQPTANDTMVIGSKTYTFDLNGQLLNTDGHIEIGANIATTRANIVNAINRTGVPGVGYASVTDQHPTVVASPFAANVMTVTAKKGGVIGNSIVTIETFANPANVFNGAVLGTTTPGVDPTQADFIAELVAVAALSRTEEVTLTSGAGTVTATADVGGADGNNIISLSSLANGTWAATTLVGGTGTVDVFPYCIPGADAYITGATTPANNGVAAVLSKTDHKVILDTFANGGMTLVNEGAGALVRVVFRTFDVRLVEF